MPLYLGIDVGASWTDLALVEEKKIVALSSVPSKNFSLDFVSAFLEKNSGVKKIDGVGTSKPRLFKEKNFFGLELKRFDEIRAIAAGARFLTGKEKGFVCSIGTGTPFIFFDEGKAKHVGGTGVGGGTLEGLARLLLGCGAEDLEALAERAESSVDLSVGDVTGGGVGIVPRDATASNFGKVGAAGAKPSREEIARSILVLVAESVGVSSVFAAKTVGCNEIVYAGRVVAFNAFVRNRLGPVAELFGAKAVFPENAEYCTAVGLARLSMP